MKKKDIEFDIKKILDEMTKEHNAFTLKKI